MAKAGGTIYIGGEFSRVGPATGSFVGIDATTGARHAFAWDGRDRRGVEVAHGIYFATLTSGGSRITTKLVRLP